MNNELISRTELLEALKDVYCVDIGLSGYEAGYESAVRDIINLVKGMEAANAIELPCKIGETVYMITVQRDSYDDSIYPVIIQTSFRLEILNEIGKRYFLTREDAEKALKRGVSS